MGGLARQLYQGLRERILDGRLAGRSRLPASRDLGLRARVSRNTVTRALDQLYAEGYIEGCRRRHLVWPMSPACAPRPFRPCRPAPPARRWPVTGTTPAAAARRCAGPFASACRPMTRSPSRPGRGCRHASGASPRPRALGAVTRPGDATLRELVAAYPQQSRAQPRPGADRHLRRARPSAPPSCWCSPDRVAVENPGYCAAGHACRGRRRTVRRGGGMATASIPPRCRRSVTAGWPMSRPRTSIRRA